MNQEVEDYLVPEMWTAFGANRLLELVSGSSVVRAVRSGESVTVVDWAIRHF